MTQPVHPVSPPASFPSSCPSPSSFHSKDHPIWPILKQIVSFTMIALCCNFLYSSGFVTKDVGLLVVNAGGLYLVDLLKNRMTK